jgi:hypothetical protein
MVKSNFAAASKGSTRPGGMIHAVLTFGKQVVGWYQTMRYVRSVVAGFLGAVPASVFEGHVCNSSKPIKRHVRNNADTFSELPLQNPRRM